MITAYNTVFGTTGTPNGFEFIVAIDWFVDRLITALNITGDTVVARVITATTEMPDVLMGIEESEGETGVAFSGHGEYVGHASSENDLD